MKPKDLKNIKKRILKSSGLIEAIKNDVMTSKLNTRETGFVICGDGEYKPTEFCIGTACTIQLTDATKSAKCKNGVKVGNHHTHPEQRRSVHSFADLSANIVHIYNGVLPHNSISCITGTESSTTSCRVPKKGISYRDAKKAYDEYKKNEMLGIKNIEASMWQKKLFHEIVFKWKRK